MRWQQLSCGLVNEWSVWDNMKKYAVALLSYHGYSEGKLYYSRWRHCMTMLSLLLSFCEGNLNQCWNIVNLTLGNRLQWNLNRKLNFFNQENAFENVVCEIAVILSRPQCVKIRTSWKGPHETMRKILDGQHGYYHDYIQMTPSGYCINSTS